MVRRRVQGAREYEVREGVGKQVERNEGRLEVVLGTKVGLWVVLCRCCGRYVLWKECGGGGGEGGGAASFEPLPHTRLVHCTPSLCVP